MHNLFLSIPHTISKLLHTKPANKHSRSSRKNPHLTKMRFFAQVLLPIELRKSLESLDTREYGFPNLQQQILVLVQNDIITFTETKLFIQKMQHVTVSAIRVNFRILKTRFSTNYPQLVKYQLSHQDQRRKIISNKNREIQNET